MDRNHLVVVIPCIIFGAVLVIAFQWSFTDLTAEKEAQKALIREAVKAELSDANLEVLYNNVDGIADEAMSIFLAYIRDIHGRKLDSEGYPRDGVDPDRFKFIPVRPQPVAAATDQQGTQPAPAAPRPRVKW